MQNIRINFYIVRFCISTQTLLCNLYEVNHSNMQFTQVKLTWYKGWVIKSYITVNISILIYIMMYYLFLESLKMFLMD